MQSFVILLCVNIKRYKINQTFEWKIFANMKHLFVYLCREM